VRRALVFAIASCAFLVLAAVAGGASSTLARLRLMDTSPVTFRGTGFKPHERVRVVVAAGARAVKWTTAGLGGGFILHFSGLNPNACTAFGALAVGNEGSRATFKRAPGVCAAP
jgi:hypothetical protein